MISLCFSVKRLARDTNTICIATIHQPNYETFALFDQLLLLANGRIMYNGPSGQSNRSVSRNVLLMLISCRRFADRLDEYLERLNHPVPLHSNPSDHAIRIVNTEFFDTAASPLSAAQHIESMAQTWRTLAPEFTVHDTACTSTEILSRISTSPVLDVLHTTSILMERNLKNYARNLLAFGVRFAMYLGMGLLLALVWIRLGTSSEKIQDRLSVHFFSVAFLGFSELVSFCSSR